MDKLIDGFYVRFVYQGQSKVMKGRSPTNLFEMVIQWLRGSEKETNTPLLVPGFLRWAPSKLKIVKLAGADTLSVMRSNCPMLSGSAEMSCMIYFYQWRVVLEIDST